jgi:aminoglycoside phosphotransferase (APT) family kinase protein
MPSREPPAALHLDSGVAAALARLGLCSSGDAPRVTPLPGGVSSDILRVELSSGPICVKRALAKLKVDAEWFAPVERNAAEAAYMRYVARIVPDAVPRLLAEDRAAGLFAMEYLAPEQYPVWKAQLRDGTAITETAAAVADVLGRVHAASARDPSVRDDFANHATFHAIRLEPYLLATARQHPDCAPALQALADQTAATRRVLVHGDVSPKNILVGGRGPVLLDAECATFGDPAFDVAFCLNHLLLKCLWRPQHAARYLACFDSFVAAYLPHVDWEAAAEMEARAARLLPGLLLARVDGKSPVEYVTVETDKNRVRRTATALLQRPASRLADVRAAWAAEIGA